jgi:pilus assembly protein Flp/PilA
MDRQIAYHRIVSRFLRDEDAATAIEYAMIAAGIGAAVVATVNALGVSVLGLFESVASVWPS